MGHKIPGIPGFLRAKTDTSPPLPPPPFPPPPPADPAGPVQPAFPGRGAPAPALPASLSRECDPFAGSPGIAAGAASRLGSA